MRALLTSVWLLVDAAAELAREQTAHVRDQRESVAEMRAAMKRAQVDAEKAQRGAELLYTMPRARPAGAPVPFDGFDPGPAVELARAVAGIAPDQRYLRELAVELARIAGVQVVTGSRGSA